MFRALQEDATAAQPLAQIASWVCGEYAEQLIGNDNIDDVSAWSRKYT